MEKIKKANTNLKTFLVLLVFGIILYFWVVPSQVVIPRSAMNESFSPDSFPNLIAITLIIVSLIGSIISSIEYIKGKRKYGPLQKEVKELTKKNLYGFFVPYIVFLLTLVYLILFKTIGFIIPTIIIPNVILFIIGCRKWTYYLYYLLFAAIMYSIFVFGLGVPIR